VKFEDGLGKVLDTQTVVSGRPATAPADPVRKGYLFSGWDTDFSKVTSDLTVKALWTKKSQEEGKYTVVFVLRFGNDPVVQTVGKGESATAPDIPTVEGFTFKDWDKEFANVTANLTITAQWKRNTAGNEHTVVFVDGYGVNPILIQRVKDGQSANPPEDPTREGYIFEGWDTDFTYVTEDLTVIAQWKEKTISIKNAKVVLSATAFAYNGKVRKPSIKKIGGKALKAGTDYEKTITYSTEEDEELPEVVNAGTVVKVTVTGKGSYTGTVSTTYRILNTGCDISKATFKIENQEYTGKEILITDMNQFTGIEDLRDAYVKDDGEELYLELGKDFEVVPGSYVKNINKGTAKVTFRGIGDYGGTKTVSFKIGQRSIVDYWQGVKNFFSKLF
jgi:uncharacterized repeat protein (TIGR02543 family)